MVNIVINLIDGRELDYFDIHDFRGNSDVLYFKRDACIGGIINNPKPAMELITIPMKNVLYYSRTIEKVEKQS